MRGALQFLEADTLSAQILFAYEPVWAIGERGMPATIGYANKVPSTSHRPAVGIYWISLYEILEELGFQVGGVNAQHVKNVPGRTKTDVLDCQLIQKLHSFDLLHGSFHPKRAHSHPSQLDAATTT